MDKTRIIPGAATEAANDTAAQTKQTITITKASPFGWPDKIGYMFGDIGNNFSFNMVNSFLMIFYTNVLGLSGAMVGLLFLIARLVDAVADVTVGRLVDNSQLTEEGRFKPWIRRMKYPLLIFSILLFVPWVKELSMGMRLGYVFLTYLLWGIFYSAVNIPYGSMASSLSDQPSDKTSLSTFRSIGAALGGTVVAYVVPLFMYVGSSHQISGERFFLVVIACSLLGFGSYKVLTKMTTERVRTSKNEPVPMKLLMTNLLKNKALIVLVIVDIVVVINQNLSMVTIAYLFNDYFKNTAAMSVAMIFNYMIIIILAPFSGWIVKRFGRKESSVVTLFFGAIIYVALVILHTHSVVIYLAMVLLGALGAGMFSMMVWAFITDVIDNQQVLTGIREDGIVYGINSFARKFAQALAGGFGGIMLTLIGYQSSSAGGVVQSDAVANSIYYMATGIPAVCCGLAAIILLFFYPLGKKQVIRNAEILREQAK
ncbi:MFS transporter [Lentilactobacillus parafarraginis]|nr:MFS transporter [Lentilactobacillus parafarraginis]TLQ18510.1 MFS transporter [Lentilactobacillus parafarraginis]